MPNKTIYVADEDISVLEEAQKISREPLSPTIIRALRAFVANNQSRMSGYNEVELLIGKSAPYNTRSFYAKQLYATEFGTPKVGTFKLFVYETLKQNYVLYIETMAEDRKTGAFSEKDKAMHVFETINELKKDLPGKSIVAELEAVLPENESSFIDI